MKQLSNQDLWNAFINRLINDWDVKYQDFGTIDNIKQQTKFCKKLSKDIHEVLQIDQNKQTIITWNTLNIYLNQNGFGNNPKKRTIDIIKRYLGDNINTNSSLIKYNSKDVTISKVHSSIPLKNIFKRKIFYVLSSCFLLLLLLSFSLYNSQNSLSKAAIRMEKEKIITLIDRANALEFDLYASVPDISDTIQLNKYYIPESVNKREIIRIVKKNKATGKILDVDHSSRLLNKQAFTFNKLSTTHAEVITIESWNLRWLNGLNKEKHAEYKVVNEQHYTLQKHDSKWLIVKNEYEGQATWFN